MPPVDAMLPQDDVACRDTLLTGFSLPPVCARLSRLNKNSGPSCGFLGNEFTTDLWAKGAR